MDQKQIVKDRLQYHFKNTDGSWNIPNGMPFMKEFLNEVEKLVSGDLERIDVISEEKYKEILDIQGVHYTSSSRWFETSLNRINQTLKTPNTKKK